MSGTITKIPLAKPSIGAEEISALNEYISEDTCIAGTCGIVREFENRFAEFVGSAYAVACSSCTTALHVACLALGVGKGSRVAIPGYTFPATGFASMYCGADVDIIDVDDDTWNMDPGKLIDKYKGIFTRDPDVVMPVHCFGNPADMDSIMDFAEVHGAAVIEDAACALPAYYSDGRHCGTIGDIGCYSFYAIKNLCTGEGGMAVTDNKELADTMRSLVDFGKTGFPGSDLPQFAQLGYNYRLSGLQAIFGIEQLKKLPEMHKRRKEIAKQYNDFFRGYSTIKEQYVYDGCSNAYQRYAVVLDKQYDPNAIRKSLASLGVQTAIGTYDLSTQPVFRNLTVPLPVSGRLFRQSISLPMYPGLTDEQVQYVCDMFKKSLIKL